ncbi:MAG: phosphoglucosamine mutase, partial [Candidatus Saccharimonadales bacterium]
LVNIRVEDKSVLEDPEIKKFIVSQTESLGDNGRVLIRPSGTEPLARVMVEADNADELANHIAEQLDEKIKQLLEVKD